MELQDTLQSAIATGIERIRGVFGQLEQVSPEASYSALVILLADTLVLLGDTGDTWVQQLVHDVQSTRDAVLQSLAIEKETSTVH